MVHTNRYWESARAQLFKRDHKMVDAMKGMEGMKAVMRKCDYLHDPLSHQQCADGYIADTKTYSPISTTENCIAVSFSCRSLLRPATPLGVYFAYGVARLFHEAACVGMDRLAEI